MELRALLDARSERPYAPLILGGMSAFLLCAYCYALPGFAWLVLLPLFMVSVISRRWTALAVLLCWLPTSLGGALQPWRGVLLPAPPSEILQGLRWGLTAWCLLVASMRPAAATTQSGSNFLVTGFLYTLALAALALMTSAMPKVSFMRVGAWGLGLFAVYKSLEPLDSHESRWLLRFYLSLLITLVVLSLASRGFRGAYIGQEVLLRGIFTHSQTLGPIAASLSAYLICQMFLRRPQGSAAMHYSLVIPCLAALYFTHSRTAVIALMLGLAVGLFLHRGAGTLRTNTSTTTVYGYLGFMLLALVLIADAGLIGSFVDKHGVGSSTFESLGSSRFGLVGKQLAVFYESPIFGNGFGLPAIPYDKLAVATFSASTVATEKGFLPTAILQETGLVGFYTALLFLYLLSRRLAMSPDPRLVAAAATSLFSNFGEATFFSFGGTGYYHWIWVIFALQSGSRTTSSESVAGQIPPPSPASTIGAAA